MGEEQGEEEKEETDEAAGVGSRKGKSVRPAVPPYESSDG